MDCELRPYPRIAAHVRTGFVSCPVYSRLSLSLPVLGGRDAFCPSEESAEVVGILIPHGGADILDGDRVILEKLLCMGETDPGQVLDEGNACFLPEEPAEVIGTDIQASGDLIEREILLVVFVNVSLGSCNE